METKIDKRDSIVVFVFLAALALSGLLWGFRDRPQEISFLAPVGEDSYAGISLEAASAIVFDLRDDTILFSRNSEAQLPLASLAKLMTALTALTLASADDLIEIDADAVSEEGDTGLFVNESWRLEDLMGLTLVSSSNDGARALSSVAGSRETFIGLMNRYAEKLGLTQTYFLNETGLDLAPNVSGAYGSARDVSALVAFMLEHYPKALASTALGELTASSLNYGEHSVANTNQGVALLAGALASKTGFTDLAGGNLALAVDLSIGHPVVVVVLGSSLNGRFTDAEELIHATLALFSAPTMRYSEHEVVIN